MLERIADGIHVVLTWLLVSSKDPRAASLFVKGLLVSVIPYLMQANDIVCRIGHECITLHPSFLEAVTNGIVAVVYYALWLVAAVWTLYGLSRKVKRTAQGKNAAINSL